jgi:transposase
MITLASGLRVYLACGVTDMRKGMVGLSMLVQQTLKDDPFDGAVFAFRGRRAGLIKLIWHDGIGLCMLTKRARRTLTVAVHAIAGGTRRAACDYDHIPIG